MVKILITEKYSVAEKIQKFKGGFHISRLGNYKVFYNQKTDYYIIPLSGHFISYNFSEETSNWRRCNGTKLTDQPIFENCESKFLDLFFSIRTLGVVQELIIGTDDDDEGEKIGYDFLRLLEKSSKILKIMRLKLVALSDSELANSFSSMCEGYNEKLAISTELRHKLDLLWGYALSRSASLAIWVNTPDKTIYSIGRVQTPLLGIISDHCKKIDEFISVNYRTISFKLGRISFNLNNAAKINISENTAKIAIEKLNSGEWSVSKSVNQVTSHPPPPLNTTALLACSTLLKMPIDEIAQHAQNLYLAGFITYPRTDNSYFTSKTPYLKILKILVEAEIVKPIVNPQYRHKIVLKADHECIMPTEIAPNKFKNSDEERVYRTIAEIFARSLMPSTVYDSHKMIVRINELPELFFEGNYNILKIVGWTRPSNLELEVVDQANQKIRLARISESITKAPSLKGQDSLVLDMEREDIGTKSTRADLLKLLYSRKYIIGFKPRITSKGQTLINFLNSITPVVLKAQLSREFKDKLNQISCGDKSVSDIFSQFKIRIHHFCSLIQSHNIKLINI